MTAAGAVCSGGIAGVGQLPTLDLPTADGGRFRTWDFRSRSHLVLYLPERAEDQLAESELKTLRAENAEVVIVVPQGAIASPSTALVAIDDAGQARCALGVERGALIVANKNSTVYWRQDIADGAPDLAEALSWLQYLNIIEPECGCCVPAWPVE